MKVRRLTGELDPAVPLPVFLDGVRCTAQGDGAVHVEFRPPIDVALPELVGLSGVSWDLEGGVLVSGRVPYLVNGPPTASTCLVTAAKVAGLGLDETVRLLDLGDRVLDGVALDLRNWCAPQPEARAEECGLLGPWRHCVAQFLPHGASTAA